MRSRKKIRVFLFSRKCFFSNNQQQRSLKVLLLMRSKEPVLKVNQTVIPFAGNKKTASFEAVF